MKSQSTDTKFIWICLFAFVLSLPLASAKRKGKTAYLFSYFSGNGEDGLHLAYSYDGLKWLPLNHGKSFLKPLVGKDSLIRDPSLLLGRDGIFHVVWTTGWWDKGFGHASSKDLIHWSKEQYLPVMYYKPLAKNTWAPELFYDHKSKTYYIFWASTVPGLHPETPDSATEKGLNHRLYFTTTKDFIHYSPTKLFFNPAFSVIDGAMLYWKGKYWLFIKNEMLRPVQKNIRVTCTRSLNKGFPINVSPPITGHYWAEGPSPLLIGKYVYVYFDKYREHTYGAVRSTDGIHWQNVSSFVSFPAGTRHGTALRVPVTVLNRLISLTR
ncbi:glycoside hydrolase family 43 protein [Microbacter margulisiae]|uniref:Beta-galactosidase n=1 Tax=Microbacter margulisiae TaxID=1350067 RepID=A0A7W5H1U8_9PORP|nr:glycoside hydrolase family 43 protein [Microbacter margulisiae]MBB3186979.1 beta-galactosidase [Microbacter margulisiae]